jgi:hypothetical protein
MLCLFADTPNSQVRYSIVAGNEGKHFDIDKETGMISIIKPFDFEKLPVIKRDSNVKQLNFTVRANDLGKPPRFSLAQASEPNKCLLASCLLMAAIKFPGESLCL